MATVFNPALVQQNTTHKSSVEEANTLASSLEMVGYVCRTKDEEGMPSLGLLLVRGGAKRPRLIVEINRVNVCGLPELAVAIRAEKPEFGHHYAWIQGIVIRDPRDTSNILEEALRAIKEAAGETAWQRRIREEREREARSSDWEDYM